MAGFLGVCDVVVVAGEGGSRGEAGGEELVWGKYLFGGDSGGSFPGCFSVLNSVFQKEESSA